MHVTTLGRRISHDGLYQLDNLQLFVCLLHHVTKTQEVFSLPEIQVSIAAEERRRLSLLGVSVAAVHCSWSWMAVGCLGCAVIGLVFQFTTFLNHDIAWVIYSAGQMLSGAEFGRDVIAANPPLIWYLSFPVVTLAETFDLNPATSFRLFVTALALSSSVWSAGIIRRSAFKHLASSLFLSSLFLFFFDAQRDFGQREYLALVFCLPYLCVSAGKSEGENYPVWESIMVGLIAGLGWALKPYFLAVPFFVELILLKKSTWRFHFRPEVLSAVTVIAAYIAYLLIFKQQYLFETIPMINQVYWGFENSRWELFRRINLELVIVSLSGWMLFRQRFANPALVHVIFAASLGFLVSLVVQNKGYSYHYEPFRATLVIGVAVWVSSIRSNHDMKSETRLLRFALTGLLLVSLARTGGWYLSYNNLGISDADVNTNRGAPGMQKRVIAAIEKYAGTERFLAFSTHPIPGFPTALYVDAEWVSRTNSRIFLPAIAKLRSLNLEQNNAQLDFAEAKEREFALRDLSQDPTVVFVDDSKNKHGIGNLSFDVLSFYLEDPAFQVAWKSYREVEPIGTTRVFVRSDLQ